jgi:predicted nuclease of predicted toxin-antitoxin system
MRILTDQDVYKVTIDKLKELGHDVVTAKDLNLQKASDQDLLNTARETNRLLLTRDKNFGALLFLKEEKITTGVILLRGSPKTLKKLHQELQKLMQEHSEDELKCSFCVMEPTRYRIRRL